MITRSDIYIYIFRIQLLIKNQYYQHYIYFNFAQYLQQILIDLYTK